MPASSVRSVADRIKAIRRVSAPIAAISTPDPAETVTKIAKATNGAPKIAWNIADGMVSLNEEGRDVLANAIGDNDSTIGNPPEALKVARKFGAETIFFVHLANRFLDNPVFVQGLSNLRETFKHDKQTCVLLGSSFTLPPELTNDIVQIDEPLPSSEDLREIVADIVDAAELEVDDENVELSVEAIRGVSAFAAEQAVALSLRKSGIDLDDLWESKRKQIEQCPGLSVFREGETFDDIGGCDEIKSEIHDWVNGRERPNAIVFIDEIEKSVAGEGDTSGVSQDQRGVLLTEMQDRGYDGYIFLGPPGAAKSAIAKAAGNEAGIPTIQLDLGAQKGSLVGQSEQQIRQAMKVIHSVSNGKALFIATCNSIATLPPELRRRFTLGTYFFDLPTEEERSKIWSLYEGKFKIPEADRIPRPADEGWTGAEIRQCCRKAAAKGTKLEKEALGIVPVSRSAADAIEKLRSQADGKFLAASHPGVYEKNSPNEKPTKRRRLSVVD